MNKIKVGIIGLGMVGTPIKRYLDSKGWRRRRNLFLLDTNPKKKYNDDINYADVIFVCVPTPNGKQGIFDLTMVRSALDRIAPGKIVVIKSTIIPGTIALLQKDYPDLQLMFNPEFLTEAKAWEDFLNPDRQLVGGTKVSWSNTKKVVKLLPKAQITIPEGEHKMTVTEAEMVKISANVFGAMKVAFANIIANMVEAINLYLLDNGVDGIEATAEYDVVRKMIGADQRIGEYWLDINHGDYRGFGGYCFPKDMKAFIYSFDPIIKKLRWIHGCKHLVLCLKEGQKALKAIWKYNETLLKVQDLTIADVSRHDKELKIKK